MVLPNFKLLHLPFLPRDRIVELIRPIDLISLSRCSKKWKKIVEGKKLGAAYSFTINGLQGIIELNFLTGECLSWNRNQPGVISNGTDTVQHNYKSCSASSDRDRGLRHCLHRFHCSFEPTFLYFRLLFPVIQAENLTCDPFMSSIGENFVNRFGLDNWKCVALKKPPSASRSCYSSAIVCGLNSPFHSLKSETVWIEIDITCHIKNFLSAKKLYIDNGYSLTDEDILNLDCEIAFLKLYRPRYEVVNAFINKWFRSGNTKLKYLHVCMRGGGVDTSMYPVLLNLLPFTSWDGFSRARYYPLDPAIPLSQSLENQGSRFDLKEGKDIRRDDGTIATVIITNVYDVYLFVWQNRFLE